MTKHVPMRMCVACRCMKPQNELIRIVNGSTGIATDEKKKLFGRGAYICRDAECVEKAKKKNLLAKHFKCRVGEEIYLAAEEIL